MLSGNMTFARSITYISYLCVEVLIEAKQKQTLTNFEFYLRVVCGSLQNKTKYETPSVTRGGVISVQSRDFPVAYFSGGMSKYRGKPVSSHVRFPPDSCSEDDWHS